MSWLSVFNAIACVAVLVHAVCVINHMSRKTNHFIRLAYILLAVGTLGVLVGPLYSSLAPMPAEVLVNAGAALALIVGTHRRQKKGWPQ